MLATDLITNSSTAIPAGTAVARTFSLLESTKGQSLRSDASVALSAPRTIRIAHATRSLKGLRDQTSNLPAPDITFDRHLCRLDQNIVQTKYLDPNFAVNYSVQLVIEVPRLGASTPSAINVSDAIKHLISMLTASSDANLIRILNNET